VSVLIFTLYLLAGVPSAPAAELEDAFGDRASQATTALITAVVGADSAEIYESFDRAEQAAYIDRFWRSHNPPLHKYYFSHHLGIRRYSVSDYFFERMDKIPELFKLYVNRPDESVVRSADSLSAILISRLPDDPVAQSARGYVLLEAGKFIEADRAFLEALKKNRSFAEARNGRALALLA
tara:strand:- start:529 stop:1071 length:543 start_codon:yes stop_codon:yes gene_type:complete